MLAKEKSGVEPVTQTSPGGSYILSYQLSQKDVKQSLSETKYWITNLEGEGVHEGIIYGGYVKWYSDTQLEYFHYIGVMPKDASKEDFIFIYDLIKKVEVRKSSLDQ